MRVLLLFLLLCSCAWADLLERAVSSAIADKKLPGCVIVVGHKGKVVYRKAFGNRSLCPSVERMTVDTVFDLASVSKIVTATSVMMLVERGYLRLNDPVSRYIPEIQDPLARAVTVQQLLTHVSGYGGGLDRTREWPQGALGELWREPLKRAAGTHFEYSDINYITLGLIVERVSGKTLDAFARENLFVPLKMTGAAYGPRDPAGVAPTEFRGDRVLRGSVHDHTAARMGGVAGHAGVFARADDLARLCQMFLNGGTLDGVRVLSPATVARMARPVVVSETGHTRGLGWDIDTAYSSNRGELFPKGSFGHTGFTGTSVWIDPVSQTYVVFLSNRVHPDGKGDVTPLRARVATLAARMVGQPNPRVLAEAEAEYAARVAAGLPEFLAARKQAAVSPTGGPVTTYRTLNGIDILVEEKFKQLRGLRLGLITNHTGRNRAGTSLVDLLAAAPDVRLVRIFSPEHGLRGEVDEKVADGVDARTGLPVLSLYGERKRPRPADLQGLDALVYDIQDCGTRFYTYSATLRYVLEEAAVAKLPVFVLDRPNPINGNDVEGPLPDPAVTLDEKTSFTCPHTMPVRHGMTMGELARMYNEERGIGADLRVIAMDPWVRSMWFDQTQQTWINPSPNLRSETAALLYPGVGLLEAGNISVGRGTDRPFEQLGAPWIDGPRLSALLNGHDVPGVRFMPVRFTPASSIFSGVECQGVQVVVVDRAAVRPLRLGLELVSGLRRLHPDLFALASVDKLLRHPETLSRLEKGETPAQIEQSWKTGVDEFKRRRAKFLLYH